MNRRKFFKRLMTGAAVVAATPSILADCVDPWCGSIAGEGIIPHDELHTDPMLGEIPVNATIGEYNNYYNFSDFALVAALDESATNVATELGFAAGGSIGALHRETSGYQFFGDRLPV